jgi:hypothetical protein
MHPLSFIWVYAPYIFHLGLRTLNPGLGLRTLSFVWVYHPPSGVITRHYLGLCTSYHLFGFTHHIFSFGTMYPQSLFGFLRTLSFVWVYHPPLGVITCYYLGVCTPVSFIWVYAPYIFSFGIMYPQSLFGLRTLAFCLVCHPLIIGDYPPLFGLFASYLYLDLRTLGLPPYIFI